MGDINQILILKQLAPQIQGPILEVGSKDYGSTFTLRKEYPGQEYTGLDLSAGKNVDIVADLETEAHKLPQSHYELIVCCSVLEHTKRPWVMATNLTALLRPGGKLFLSVPWVWRYHMYPDDYWRFSPQSLPLLFPDLSWSEILYSTNVPQEQLVFESGSSKTDDSMKLVIDLGNGYSRNYMPYLMVNGLGVKAAQ